MKIIKLLVLFFIIIGNLSAQNRITQYLTFGEYPIGYKLVHTYDHGRSFFPKYDFYGNRTEYPLGRPMQISIWYPSEENASSPKLKYGDYIGFTASEIDFSQNTADNRQAILHEFIHSMGAVEKQQELQSLLDEPVQAVLNAEEGAQDFPILIYAPPMNSSAIDNSILCEYLASKGFIVLSVMAKGTYNSLQDRSIESVQTQAEDLAYVLDYARQHYDSERIGVLGFSLGGLANILFATKNKNVDATVCLDGSIMSMGWLSDFKESGLYAPEDFSSKLLFIGKNLKSPEQNPSDFWDSVKYADKAFIRYDMDQHNYFSALYLLYEMIADDELTSSGKEKNYRFYAEIATYTGNFLDRYLKNTGVFEATPKTTYDHSFIFKKGLRKPLDPSAVGQLIIDKGYDYVEQIIDSVLVYEKEYLQSIDWRILQQTSATLSSNNRLNEAIQTLKLSDKIFPNWYITQFSLGKLYEESGKVQEANKHYLLALQDNPKHPESLEALNRLQKQAPDYHKLRVNELRPYLGRYNVSEKRHRNIYQENGKLYLSSNYWEDSIELWPYKRECFLVESNSPGSNMQVLFQFDEEGKVVSLRIRGLNSGRINAADMKVK